MPKVHLCRLDMSNDPHYCTAPRAGARLCVHLQQLRAGGGARQRVAVHQVHRLRPVHPLRPPHPAPPPPHGAPPLHHLQAPAMPWTQRDPDNTSGGTGVGLAASLRHQYERFDSCVTLYTAAHSWRATELEQAERTLTEAVCSTAAERAEDRRDADAHQRGRAVGAGGAAAAHHAAAGARERVPRPALRVVQLPQDQGDVHARAQLQGQGHRRLPALQVGPRTATSCFNSCRITCVKPCTGA